MPLSHQAQRKTPATGVHVRPPWGSSGWNKSGAMVPKDAKATPPPARPRSALTRREANVPRPSPAKPQAQPRASRAREKENPDGTSAPATPAAPVAPARTPPPFAAPPMATKPRPKTLALMKKKLPKRWLCHRSATPKWEPVSSLSWR